MVTSSRQFTPSPAVGTNPAMRVPRESRVRAHPVGWQVSSSRGGRAVPAGRPVPDESLLPNSRLISTLLAAPLVVAVFNVGLATWVALVVAVLIFIPRLRANRVGRLDIVAGLAGSWVLLTSLWSYAPELSVSASRGGFTAFVYFVAVRLGIASRREFERFVLLLCWTSLGYAAYFLTNAGQYAGSRFTINFANPNYTSAVLAFGAALSLWVFLSTAAFPIRQRVIGLVSAALSTISVLETGSRAGLAGIALAAGTMLLMRRAAVVARALTAALMVATAVMPFVPSATRLLADAAGGIAYSAALTRGGLNYTTLSGREAIWDSSKQIISHSWLVGSGLDGYRLAGAPPILAHSWGLEYLASVGLVGTVLIAVVIGVSFLNRGSPSTHAGGTRSTLWNASTSLAILPSMALSTHQWTLWARVVMALWSRSFLLDIGRHDQDARIDYEDAGHARRR